VGIGKTVDLVVGGTAMYIRKVIIRGFRSLNNVDIEFHPGINVLVGKNNAGKSNVIRALDLILGEKWPTYREIQEKDFYRHISGLSRNSFLIAAQLSGNVNEELIRKDNIRCRISENVDPPDWNRIENLFRDFYTRRKQGDDLIKFLRDLEEIWIYLLVPKSSSNKVFGIYGRKGSTWSHLNYFGSTLRDALLTTAYVPDFRDPQKQLNITPYSWYGKLIQHLYGQKTDTQEKSIIEARNSLRTTMDEIFRDTTDSLRRRLKKAIFHHEISFKAGAFTKDDDYKQITLFVNDGVDAPYYDKGSGIQSALVIALFAHYCEQFHRGGSLLLVEEPEIYLHPQARRALHTQFLEFVNSSQNGERQVILSTHSPEFLRAVPIPNVILVRKPPGCTSTEVAQIDVEVGEEAKYQQMLHRNAEMMFADHVVLVEGGEVHLISILANKYFEKGWLDSHNVSVCDVGGKASFKNYVKLLDEYGISWTIFTDLDFLRDEIYQFDNALGNALELEHIKEALDKIKKDWEEIKEIPKGRKIKERVFDPNTRDWVKLYNDVDRALQDLIVDKPIPPERFQEIKELWDSLKNRVAGKNYEALREKCGKEIDSVAEYLAQKGVFVLREGELEDYFTDEALKLDSSKERRALKVAEKIAEECQSWDDVTNWLKYDEFACLLDYLKSKLEKRDTPNNSQKNSVGAN